VIGNARVCRLQVDELTVGRLRVRDHTGSVAPGDRRSGST
jgi:hypothetical protein